jgi:hypothetical protein
MLLGSFPKPLPVGKRGRAVRGFALHPPTNRQHCRGISSVCATPKPSTDKENLRGARGLPERLDYRTPQIRGQTRSPEIWSLPTRLSCFLGDNATPAIEESRLARELRQHDLWHPNCSTFQQLYCVLALKGARSCARGGNARFNARSGTKCIHSRCTPELWVSLPRGSQFGRPLTAIL